MKIVTTSGEIVPLLADDFKPKIRDIAVSLSRLMRYTGHSRYSVAQHSVLVSRLVPQHGIYPLSGLLHDAHEAFCGDLSGPMKEALRTVALQNGSTDAWSVVEASLAQVVRRAYGLPETLSKTVHEADKKAYGIEIAKCFDATARKAFKVLGYPPDFSGCLDMEGAGSDRIWDAEEAKIRFLARFRQLCPLEPECSKIP
jgi:hypothetical protein